MMTILLVSRNLKITDPKINTGSLVITDIDETDEIILRINVN